MNPVTGEIKKIARYEETANGTKIEINVNDRADSFFIMFREKAVSPSVVKASASTTELDLFYNAKPTRCADPKSRNLQANNERRLHAFGRAG